MNKRKIYQFFEEKDLIVEQLGLSFSDLNYNHCWYPSSGMDFRPLVHFESSELVENTRPTVYLYSDSNILGYSRISRNPFESGMVLFKSTKDQTILTVKSCTKVHLKQVMDFMPFEVDTFNNGILHSSFKDELSGSVFFIITELECIRNSRKVKVEVPLFYFTYENMDLLMNFLLPNSINVHTLIHVLDGSSYGGSEVSMHFIYQFIKELKMKRIITDANLSSKEIDYELMERQILEYYHFQVNNNFFGRSNKYISQGIFDSFRINPNPIENWKTNSFLLQPCEEGFTKNVAEKVFCYYR
jgi:hypothetical protein